MEKARWIIITVVIVVALGAGAYLIYQKTHSTTTDMAGMNMSSSASSESNVVSTNKISIKDFVFGPAGITVKKGTKVTWTNDDSASHTVTETDDLKGPNSATLAKGQTYSFTFESVGTYHYRCNFHPQMTGVVVVTD